MLCDEILADEGLPRLYPGFEKTQQMLRGARKFVLAPDFTAAADGLVNNRPELERIAPFCRLPFPVCWFELAQADRPQFLAAPMHFEGHQTRPKRVGFLTIAEKENELWRWNTVLMWSLIINSRGPTFHESFGYVQGSTTPNNASQIVIRFDTKDGIKDADETGMIDSSLSLAKYIELGIAPFCPPWMKEALLNNKHSDFSKLMQADWGGEIRYLFAMLGLFNARNVMEVQTVDKTEHNRKRAKHGDPPLCSHTLLKIRAMHRRSFIGSRGKGTSADIRKHFVVGHWKARRTGLFWWNPHWRGTDAEGIVTHDYEVKT